MNDTIHEKLQRIELLLNEGDYKTALKLVEAISSRELQTMNNKFTCLLLESRLRIKIGELEKARVGVEELLSLDRKEVNLLRVLDAFILKAEISWRLGNLDEGVQSVQEGEKLLVELGNEEEILVRKKDLLSQAGIIYWYMGNLDQAAVFHEQSLLISEKENDKQGIADSLNNLGLIQQSKGKFNLALEYYKRSLPIYEDLGDKDHISKILNNIGITYSLMGDQELTLKNLQKSHQIKVDLNNKLDIALPTFIAMKVLLSLQFFSIILLYYILEPLYSQLQTLQEFPIFLMIQNNLFSERVLQP